MPAQAPAKVDQPASYTATQFALFLEAALTQNAGWEAFQGDGGRRYILIGDRANPQSVTLRIRPENGNTGPVIARRTGGGGVTTFNVQMEFIDLWQAVEAAKKLTDKAKAKWLRQPRPIVIEPAPDPLAAFGDRPFGMVEFAERLGLTLTHARPQLQTLVQYGKVQRLAMDVYIVAHPASELTTDPTPTVPTVALATVPCMALVPIRKAAPVFAYHFMLNVFEQYATPEVIQIAPVISPAPF